MKKHNNTRKKGISYIFLELFLLILVSSIIFIVIYSAMQEGNHKRRIIVPEALDAPYQPYRPIESINNSDRVTPMDSMMRDVYVVQREINQGSHQLYLFFDTFTHRPARLDLKHFDLKNPKDAQWYNFGIYLIMFLLVVFPTLSAFLAKFIFNRRVKDKREWFNDKVRDNMGRIDKAIGFIINHKIMIVFIVFLIAILLSMVNLSIPLEKEFEYRADPFFVFVCFSSLAVATVALKYVLKGLKKIKIGGETSLSSKSIFRNTLFWGALGVWAMGFLCYFIGMYSLGTQKSVLASIVRPALESGKMFVLSDSTKEISFTLRNNGAFMGFYTICKLGFLLISSFALVSVVWSRIVSYSTIRKRSVDPGDLYVFFGFNENSKILAQDVAKRLREEKKKRDAEKRKLEEEKKKLRKSITTLEGKDKNLKGTTKYKSKKRKRRLIDDINKPNTYYDNLTKNIKKLDKDIEKIDAESVQHWTIAMVENRNNPSEGDGNGMTISSLIGMFNFRKDAYAETREIDKKALLVVSDSSIGSRECSEQIEDVRKMKENGEEPDKETKYGLFNSLGLKNLSKMIRNANEGIYELIQDVKKKTENGEDLDDKTKKKLFKQLAHHLDLRDLSTIIKEVMVRDNDKLIRNAEKDIKRDKEWKNKKKKKLLERLCDILGFDEFIDKVQKAKKYNHKCHFFFLDEDARANIDAADNLREMLEIVHPNHPETFIYCLARDNAFSSLLERKDTNDKKGNDDKEGNDHKITIKLLDLSVMAAQTLFLDPDNHPINFVDCDIATATVKSRFDALILGFGRSGRDIVRYLYEFGTFLDHDKIKDGKVVRSPFQCTIMDKDIDLIMPRYLAKIPAVKAVSGSDSAADKIDALSNEDGNNGQLLRFVKAALNSDKFVSLIDEKLNKKENFANFVVINLGSDSANMGALTYLVDQVMRNCKGDLGKLRIFVRSYDPSYEDMVRDRANHYKELLGGKSIVKIFGQRSELLSYDMVVADQISSRADDFEEIYSQKCQRNHQDQSANQGNADDNCTRWRDQNRDLRQKTQNIHNGIHIDTKLRLVGLERHINYNELLMNQMGKELIKDQISDLVQEILQQEPKPKLYKHPLKWIMTYPMYKKHHDEMVNQIQRILAEKRKEMEDMLPFPDKDLKQDIKQFKESIKFADDGRSFHLLKHLFPFISHLMPDGRDQDYKKLNLIYKNLAINEHLRWVASLEMLGYTGPNDEQKATMTKCDDVAMVHHGMVDWNDPYNKEEYKAFDYLLVKSSFDLAYNILQNHEESFEQARSEALKKAMIKELEKNIDTKKIDQIQKEELIKMIEQVLDEEPKHAEKEESSDVAEEFGADE